MESLNIGKRRSMSEVSSLREEGGFIGIRRNIGIINIGNQIGKEDSVAGELEFPRKVRHMKS